MKFFAHIDIHENCGEFLCNHTSICSIKNFAGIDVAVNFMICRPLQEMHKERDVCISVIWWYSHQVCSFCRCKKYNEFDAPMHRCIKMNDVSYHNCVNIYKSHLSCMISFYSLIFFTPLFAGKTMGWFEKLGQIVGFKLN